jgi:beta-galactosidase
MPVQGQDPFIPDVFSRESGREDIDLGGTWEFRRDPRGIGEDRGWHEGRGKLDKTMEVPGAPQAQGHGRASRFQRTHFEEPFWIRRRFDLPAIGPGQRVWLRLGCVEPAAKVFINGSMVGYTKSSRTPQRVDVTDLVRPGGDNLIAIRVCERPKIRLDGLWEMPGLTVLWTGPYGRISCEITGNNPIVDAYIRPDLKSRSVRVWIRLSKAVERRTRGEAIVLDDGREVRRKQFRIDQGKSEASTSVRLVGCKLWSPDSPKLYDLRLDLADGDELDSARFRFGMRELTVRRGRLQLNGRPFLARFYGENHLHPDTLCPPADKDWYLPRLALARKFGMNGLKSCVDMIPLPYMEAADEVGMVVIQEMPFGLSGLRENRQSIPEEFREYYLKELRGLVRATRNHACVVAYSMSSEMIFERQTQESFDFFNRKLPTVARELAPHGLVIDCTGYAAPNQEVTGKGRRVTDLYVTIVPFNRDVLEDVRIPTDGLHPMLLHEYHWWGCYPDLRDRARYEATQMRPFWLDRLERTASRNGQLELLPRYRENSLWLQALCRKDGIEYVRRSDAQGYILWLLVDLGQWSEGLLDDFWAVKNVSPGEFLRSNGDTVVILAEEGNRCLRAGDLIGIPLAVDHHGEETLRECTVEWRAREETGAVIARGEIGASPVAPGRMRVVGRAQVLLPVRRKAFRFELEAILRRGRRKMNENAWSFWAFPEPPEELRSPGALDGSEGTVLYRQARKDGGKIPSQTGLVISDHVDEELVSYLRAGGRCLLFTEGARIENPRAGPSENDPYRQFRTIRWNAGDHGNSGTVVEDHPSLCDFPHEGRCDLNFASLIKGKVPMEFGSLVRYGVEPIVRVIDHYKENRNNAHMLEFRIGRGRVLASSLGVPENLDRIEARYLLWCLTRYCMGNEFEPKGRLPPSRFLHLFGTDEGGLRRGNPGSRRASPG